ncbi:MAG: Ig-like domain-containing protein, partial [Lacibacter sp.]
MKRILPYILVIFLIPQIIVQTTGCANIVPPSGGLRDSLPPVPVRATPRDSALNAHEQKITITFDEYIELRSANEKVLISPYPTKDPVIESKLR